MRCLFPALELCFLGFFCFLLLHRVVKFIPWILQLINHNQRALWVKTNVFSTRLPIVMTRAHFLLVINCRHLVSSHPCLHWGVYFNSSCSHQHSCLRKQPVRRERECVCLSFWSFNICLMTSMRDSFEKPTEEWVRIEKTPTKNTLSHPPALEPHVEKPMS